ncbi:MAG: hypothetical protein AB9880_03670 [Christensenellales bacterium]
MTSKRQFVSAEVLAEINAKNHAEQGVRIQPWFMNKEFSQSERYAIQTAEAPIVSRKTEKASLLKWATEFGTITKWVPDSCIIH